MEFRGIIYLNPQTAYQFAEYLSKKELELSSKMIEILETLAKKNEEPVLKKTLRVKLKDVLSLAEKEIRELVLNKNLVLKEETLNRVFSVMDLANWHYLEILENSEIELFSQIKTLGIEAFQEDIETSVHSIKKTLIEHLDDFYWYLKRLNKQAKDLQSLAVSGSHFSYLKKMALFFYSPLDSKIFSNLQKSRKFLLFNYKKFYEASANYKKLLSSARKKRERLKGCAIFNKFFDDTSKVSFEKIYELLKIEEANEKLKLISQDDLNNFVKNAADPRRMFHIFEEYQNALLKEVFEKSRLLKSGSILDDEKKADSLLHELEEGQKEVHLLASMTSQYRDLLIQTDPDPYVRSRFGFKDWIVGKEPPLAENLRYLSYDAEETDLYFQDLIKALSKPKENEFKLREVKNRSVSFLHEMGQPLISESTMKHSALKILELIQELDEFGTTSWEVVDFVGLLFSKLLRYDWKYHLLFNIPEFEKAYAIHIGILNQEHEDRSHLNRMDEFRRLLKEVKDLMRTKGFYKNKDEFTFLLNDIKSSLQDFLGFAQNRLQGSVNFHIAAANISFQLMEYRYLFGRYFHEMEQSEENLQWVKKEFLFVNQYLEAIEATLN
ncbi:MAG TPA: hypothetical protein PLC42_03360 [Parachlamydiaceae bacterium]|nr:hypothetical protein [Parachlamydiaceae bacterium]